MAKTVADVMQMVKDNDVIELTSRAKEMARVVEATLDRIDGEGGLSEPASLAGAIELDGWARKIASACL